jgi:hypothetical protein
MQSAAVRPERRESLDDEGQRTGSLHGGAEHEHRDDQQEQPPVHRSKAFLGIDAARDQDHRRSDQCERQDRRGVDGGEEHHAGEGADRQRGLAASEVARGARTQQDEAQIL